MAKRGRDEWEENVEFYSESQVEGILEFCDIEVVSDTNTHFLCYCPFHGNTDSPAFAVDKAKGLWTCFNPSCENAGTLEELIRRRKKLNMFQALRTIAKYKDIQVTPFHERLKAAMTKEEFPSMSDDKIAELHSAFWNSPALEYMHGRGFTDETLKFFEVGYSPERIYPPPYKSRPEMVVVPMRDIKGNGVGVVGRSIEGKTFKNSSKLPKSQTAWNIHNAKKQGGTVIVCESTFDGMRIHQAGYPNVIALLGGHASPEIMQQINRHFERVIIMTDFESGDQIQYRPNCRMCNYRKCVGHRAGRDLGRSIINQLPNKKVMWAAYDDTCVYPHDAKDASDMTDAEIRQCLKKAVSNLTYVHWNPEKSEQVVAS